ncbi:FAD-dependent oxidoreductase [Chloroflexota bacterium]
MEEKFDTIIVGAGLAGIACAYKLAKSGCNVLVVERGKFAGAKNMWGGAFCGPVLSDLIPDFWDEAPIERHVARHIYSFSSNGRSSSISFEAKSSDKPPYESYIILRSKFDSWFAKQAGNAGAIIAEGLEATDLLWNGNQVCGIKCREEDFRADVVVLCDGINSELARKAGLSEELKPDQVKQGVKEIIKLSPEIIEQRFNLQNNQGVSWQFVGSCTRGLPGGAFIYTNKDSLSVGIVVQLSALAENKVTANELLEDFKASSPVCELIKDGKLEEYSAHLIPVSGRIPKLYNDGLMVAGDAAGLVIGTGLILEGGNLAVASGIAAADTVQFCREKGDFSSGSLSHYQHLLEDSFVLKDLETFKRAPHFLENSRIYQEYPDLLCNLLDQTLTNNGKPRYSTYRLFRKLIKGKVSITNIIKDAIRAMRSI